MPLKYNTLRKYQGFREVGKGWWCTAGMGSVTQKWLFVCYARPSEERWRELGIMDYALPMVVEKVAVSSHEVLKRDTMTSHALRLCRKLPKTGRFKLASYCFSEISFSDFPFKTQLCDRAG